MAFNTERVYTALNADEVKIGSSGYFADTIERLKIFVKEEAALSELYNVCSEHDACRFYNGSASYALFYLVKDSTRKQYRPYTNTAEMLAHKQCILHQVKSKDGTICLISAYSSNEAYVSSVGWKCYADLFADYVYADDTPFGIEVEDD